MLIISLVLFQVLIFAGLIFILRRVMTKNVTDATRHLEELNQDYTKKEQEVNRQLQEAQQKSQNILKETQEEVEKLRAQIIKEAESERDKILEQARAQSDTIIQQAEKSRQMLIAEINQRIVENALIRAAELIQQVLPERLRERIHRYWVEDLISSSFGDLDRLHLPEGVLEVRAASAFKLTNDQRQALKAKIEEKLGHQINFREEIAPGIIAGLVVNIGSLVLDGSLKNKIQEKAKSA